MTVFKAFLKVLNKYKIVIIIYTVFLIGFSGFNMQTSDNSTNFVESKPDILIINKDKEEGVTKNLIEYIQNNSNIKEIENNEDAISDALFYRNINYIIYIPDNYREEFLKGLNPKIEVKSAGDYQSSYAEMLLSRYIKVSNTYIEITNNEEILISKINETLSKDTEIEITSKLDTNSLSKATFYYNFTNFSILAGSVYVICLILSSFREEKIVKRTVISSMNYKEYNMKLLLSNGLFAIVLWMFYVLLSFILVGNIMFTTYGLIYIVNSFIFAMCALTLAFLIGNLVSDKNALNGIVNVVALGTSFLCGAFVPVELLPSSVLTIAKIFPSYYFINTNDITKGIEEFNIETLTPVLTNMSIMILFIIGFIIITNIISSRKRKIG